MFLSTISSANFLACPFVLVYKIFTVILTKSPPEKILSLVYHGARNYYSRYDTHFFRNATEIYILNRKRLQDMLGL